MSLVNLLAQSYDTPLALTPDYWIPQDTHLHPSELKDLPESLKPQIERVLDAEYIEDSDSKRLSAQQQLALGFKDPKQRIKQKWIYNYLKEMMPQYQDEAKMQIKYDDEMLDEDLQAYRKSHKENIKTIENIHKNWDRDQLEDEEDEENAEESELEDELEAEAEVDVARLESLELDDNDKQKLAKSTEYLKNSLDKAKKLSKLAKVAAKAKKVHKKPAAAAPVKPIQKKMKIDNELVLNLQNQIEQLKAQLAEQAAPKNEAAAHKKKQKKPAVPVFTAMEAPEPKKAKILKPAVAKKIKRAALSKKKAQKPQLKAKVVKKLVQKAKDNDLLKKKLAEKYMIVAHRKKEQKPKKPAAPQVNDEVMVDFLMV